MARFTIVAVIVAALLFLSGTSANRGSARDLQAVSKCVVNTSAQSLSVNQIVCKKAYKDAYATHIKYFCRNPHSPVPPTVTATAKAKAKAVAEALAVACAKVSMTGTISPSCEKGSYSFFDAIVRAKAMAQAVASSFADAFAAVIGSSAFNAVSADLLAQSQALATTCETRYLDIYRYHQCVKTTCSPSSCGIKCTYNDEAFVTATAKAVAVAIAKAEATVETYYNSKSCDKNCKIKLCGYVCPNGC